MPSPVADSRFLDAAAQDLPCLAESPRLLAGAALAVALQDTRTRSLRALALWQSADRLGARPLPMLSDFNPPAWEAGHIAWFQEFWLSRNPLRHQGREADPDAPRRVSRLAGSDGLYHSSLIAHDLRWSLNLPDPQQLADFLDHTLQDTLTLLDATTAALNEGGISGSRVAAEDRVLYFFRLALFHEDMHNEAAVYMANHHAANLVHANAAKAEVIARANWAAFAEELQARASPLAPRRALSVAGGNLVAGHSEPGFAFDNECPPVLRSLESFSIDSCAVSVGDYLEFILDGGYRTARWWSPQAWQAQSASGRSLPHFHRLSGRALERCEFGVWRQLQGDELMLHVNAFEAEAWCAWAGRRLPSESEWEHAAGTVTDFSWGSAWEWTASSFQPFPGFRPDPYRDYSEPWFGSRRTLKGASLATHPRMRNAAYRNFFVPSRTDIFSGFRSCAQQSEAEDDRPIEAAARGAGLP